MKNNFFKLMLFPFCLASNISSAQSLDFTFDDGTITPFTLDNPSGAVQGNEDFISFAFGNNIPLGIDNSSVFQTTIGPVVFETTDFDVGSVTPNTFGGQDITFINGDVMLLDDQGNIIADDFINDLLANGNANWFVQTSNLSGVSDDPLNVLNGTFTSSFIAQIVQAAQASQDFAQVEQQQEQNNTNTRITNSVVANRVANIVSTGFGRDYQNSQYEETSSSYNSMAASADSASNNDYSPDVFWGKHVYTNLTEDGNNLGFDTELYHFIGGLDKRIGDFYLGSALTYVYGQTRESVNDNSTHSVGITPYVAYKINSFLFASALAGYNYTSINGTQGSRDADVHDYNGELNINGFKGFGSFWVKGRAGLRYTHNVTSLKGSVVDGDYDQLTWIGDVEFGYNINENINVFTGVLYEYTDREATIAGTQFTSSNLSHDGVAYFRAGVNYHVNNKLSLGFDASSDLNDEDNNNLSYGASIRLTF